MNREIKRCNICGFETENAKSFSNHVRYGCKSIKYSLNKCKFCNSFLPKRKPSEIGYFCNRHCYMQWKKGMLLGCRKERVLISNYYYIMKHDHPRANKKGYIAEQIFLMEKKIGRLLSSNETVHHIDHDSKNNSINNLMLMTIHDHLSFHAKEKYKKSGGKKWIKEL